MIHLASFQSLVKTIKDLISHQDEQPDPDIIAQKFRNVVQILVDADKTGKQEIYDMYCELNVMECLGRLLKFNKEVVIKTLSLILINLKNELWMNHLMTDKLFTKIIDLQMGQETQELVQHYISFLKSLSIRLNINNLSLFYNKKYCTFPLLYKALSFYNHPNNMVRTSVMNMTLGVMKIKDQRLSKYFETFPFTLYLIHFCHSLNYQLKVLGVTLQDPKLTKNQLKMLITDQNDSIYYLHDLYQHGSSIVKQNIKNILFRTTVLPTLINQLFRDEIPPKLILFLIHSILKIFKDKQISEFIAILLFGKQTNPQILKKINDVPYKPQSFHDVFNAKDISFFCSFNYQLADHCEQLFKDINNFQTQHEHKKSIGQTSPNSLDFYEQLKKISDSLDFDILSIDQPNSFNLFEKTKQSQNSVNNPIRQKIQKLLSEGNDSLAWVITNIIITIQKKEEVSNDTLKYCGLLMPRQDTINYLDEFNIKSITTLKQILLPHLKKQVSYRIVTTKNIVHLISELFLTGLTKEQLKGILQGFQETILLLKTDLKIENLKHIAKDFFAEYKRWSNYAFIPENFIPFSVFSLPEEAFPQIKNEQHLPTNKTEQVIKNIQLFALNRSLVSTYITECMKANKQQLPNFQQSYLNKFSQTTNKWRVGKSYIIQNRFMVECQQVFDDKRKPINLLLVEDPYNFVLVDPSKDNSSAEMYLNIVYKDIELQIQKSNPKNIFIRWLSQTSGEKVLSFSNEIQATEVLERLRRNINNSFEQVQGFILKFVLNCEKDLKSLISSLN